MNILMIKLSYRQSEKYTLGALSIFHQKNKIDYSISIPILIYSYFIRTRGTNVIFNFRRFEVLIIRVWITSVSTLLTIFIFQIWTATVKSRRTI